MNSESEVTLEVENVFIKCKKQDLICHSDYFKVMFEGNFIERNKEVIKLEGIDLKAMNIILALLWDKTFLINEEDILSVLQVSCMLQFIEIKAMCTEKLKELLLPRNCLKIWLVTEQLDIKPLYLKAKSMAFIEFDIIKELDGILELQLKQLCYYLGNTNLQCKSEIDVFQTCMRWWYENSGKHSNDFDSFMSNSTETYLNFLFCLDFKYLSISDIQEMMLCPDISSDKEITEILQCVIDLKQNIDLKHNELIVNKARILCSSKSRNCSLIPCILANNNNHEHLPKRQKLSDSSDPIVFYDAFKRKQYYSNIGSTESSIAVMYYDNVENKLKKLLNVDEQKCGNLDGFKIIGYKELIFLFGGEFLIGKGNWNKNFWAYNTIREHWERKSVIPFVRRHFETCICGNFLYIIGGTGNYRVVQDNMFWYNYKEDKWSKQIHLPCAGREIRCCCWNDQLLLLNISNKSGYFFDQSKTFWYTTYICDDNNLAPVFPDKYTVFAYRDSIYIKGPVLIEMKMINQKLVIVSCKPLKIINCDQVESILCGDILYSLYKQTCPVNETSSITFEKYYIDSHKQDFIENNIPDGAVIHLGSELYTFRMSTTIFGFQHHELVAGDKFINDL